MLEVGYLTYVCTATISGGVYCLLLVYMIFEIELVFFLSFLKKVEIV